MRHVTRKLLELNNVGSLEASTTKDARETAGGVHQDSHALYHNTTAGTCCFESNIALTGSSNFHLQ